MANWGGGRGVCRAKNKQENYTIYLHLVHSLLEFIRLFYYSIKEPKLFKTKGSQIPGARSP